VPNTTLRSRLLGKPLVRAFPSPLPPHTVLDCILDAHWRENGVLHVLDVVRWKAQDVGDCEAAFRFWFRDARLAELPPPAPPLVLRGAAPLPAYRFPYPTTFVPVPHAPDTALPALLAHAIPAARAVRTLDVPVPVPAPAPPTPFAPEIAMLPTPLPTPAPHASQAFVPARAQTAVQPDGLLLYVREAGYEPGASPLSHWVPLALGGDAAMDADGSRPLDLFEWCALAPSLCTHDSSADVSCRLVRRRLEADDMMDA
jgi:snurportin-1